MPPTQNILSVYLRSARLSGVALLSLLQGADPLGGGSHPHPRDPIPTPTPGPKGIEVSGKGNFVGNCLPIFAVSNIF